MDIEKCENICQLLSVSVFFYFWLNHFNIRPINSVWHCGAPHCASVLAESVTHRKWVVTATLWFVTPPPPSQTKDHSKVRRPTRTKGASIYDVHGGQKDQNQLICDSDKGGGVHKSEHFADIIYGSLLKKKGGVWGESEKTTMMMMLMGPSVFPLPGRPWNHKGTSTTLTQESGRNSS